MEQATVIGNTTQAMGRGANDNLSTPLCVEYVDDYAIVYLLAPNNGMAAYKVYNRGDTGMKQTPSGPIHIFAGDGNIYIEGAEPGDHIIVHDLTGRLLINTAARDGLTSIELSLPGQTVIVAVRGAETKIRL